MNNEVKKALGEFSLDLIIGEIQNGIIKKDEVKLTALKMGGSCHRVFREKCCEVELSNVMKYIFNRWYREELPKKK